jgi:hypothetical protein
MPTLTYILRRARVVSSILLGPQGTECHPVVYLSKGSDICVFYI